jgi:ABC-type glycerol-3-phosphate transport system permease component
MKTKNIMSVLKIIFLSMISLTIIYPAIWVISNSLKTSEDRINNPWNLIPDPVMWSNYRDAWITGTIGAAFKNSIIVTVFSVLLLVLVAYLASYALARLKFTGRNIIMVTLLSLWMVPGQALIIPLYRLEALLGINNSYIGLILPYATGGLPFAIFVLSTFIRTIPWEIEEATIIDGASRLRIIFQIIAPLSIPGISTIIIFSFMGNWNELFLALVLLVDRNLRTLPIAILNFNGRWGFVDYPRLFAALIIISMPIIIIYVIFQKQFIKGLTAGAVKA